MSLPDAAAEFARQLVTALAGDAGREQREHERDLEELVKVGREKQQLLHARLYELRGAVRDVLSNDGDLLDETRRAALVRAYRASEARIEPDPEQRETD
jgi:hypothetical protein